VIIKARMYSLPLFARIQAYNSTTVTKTTFAKFDKGSSVRVSAGYVKETTGVAEQRRRYDSKDLFGVASSLTVSHR